MRTLSRKQDVVSAETQQAKADLEEKMGRMVMRAMPQLSQRFRRFARKIENFDFRRTATFKTELERDFTSLASQLELQDTGVLQDMMELLSTPAFKDLLTQFVHTAVQMAKAEARVDNRYSLLLRW